MLRSALSPPFWCMAISLYTVAREQGNRRAASVTDSASATSMMRNRSTTLASCLRNAVSMSPPVICPILFTFGVTAQVS